MKVVIVEASVAEPEPSIIAESVLIPETELVIAMRHSNRAKTIALLSSVRGQDMYPILHVWTNATFCTINAARIVT
jgi:hypothetical protein